MCCRRLGNQSEMISAQLQAEVATLSGVFASPARH